MSGDLKQFYDAVVIGGGPAGLTAGIYLARACFRVLIVEKEKFGGQITLTAEVVNYPGIKSVSGEELTGAMQKQAENFGAEFMLVEVTGIEDGGDCYSVSTNKGKIKCFGVLIATGAHPRKIGFKGEAEFRGHGVAYCATCDGEFFTGKDVFVVGGGFAAAEESIFLTKYAAHVTILIRGNDFKCAKSVADEVRENKKITVLTNSEIEEVSGDTVLRKIVYRNNKTNELTEKKYENDTFGVFVFAGYEPSTAFVSKVVELNDRGYIVTDAKQKTSKDGIYAAGDVCIKDLRQVVTATGDGALAATELEKYCTEMQKKTGIVPDRPKRKTAESDTAHGRPAAEAAGKTAVSGSPESAGTEKLFTDEMVTQLNMVFERMKNPLVLKMYLDERQISQELKQYMIELSSLTDKLTVQTASNSEEIKLPCVKVLKADGTETGMAFHGVPGGHEFNSFILGLYNMSGEGQSLDDSVKSRIKAIDKDVHMDIFVSLTCTMCPDLVTAAQKIASQNTRITTDVYDLAHFPEIKDKYNIMGVPCYVINGKEALFGKKTIEELLDLIEKE
ncbi:FAD-dependent oxidoreductase [Treponema parvum]|uniref:FAD-dependent oxidoreductase n=1 Tax=Treponema parvum TaxID=138851 RepID=UPI001AEC5D53|nr:FAD-dependent oxidoreductase [Treponema parvum]QTQ15806.1 FAD-dependent oxidoreductase [Treponema parvum]